MCFGSTLICPHEEFLIPHPPRTRMQSSAGSPTRPLNAGTRNPRGLTRPSQDSKSSTYHVCLHIVEMSMNLKSSPAYFDKCALQTYI